MKAQSTQSDRTRGPLGHSVSETAETFGCHPRTIRRAIAAGELEAAKILDKVIVLQTSIDAKIEEAKQHARRRRQLRGADDQAPQSGDE
jgi:hypothetical protein